MRPALKSQTKFTQPPRLSLHGRRIYFVSGYSVPALFAPGEMNIFKPRANLENAAFRPFFAITRFFAASIHKHSCVDANNLVARGRENLICTSR